jgi:hypothetical protein
LSFDERTEKMAYDLKIQADGDVLKATATGTRSFETVLALSQDILTICVEKKIKKVLIDVLALEGRLSTIDAYEISARRFPKMRYRGVIAKCAVVDLKEFEETYRFFETVAVNRGLFFRIFSDTAEAIAWLEN